MVRVGDLNRIKQRMTYSRRFIRDKMKELLDGFPYDKIVAHKEPGRKDELIWGSTLWYVFSKVDLELFVYVRRLMKQYGVGVRIRQSGDKMQMRLYRLKEQPKPRPTGRARTKQKKMYRWETKRVYKDKSVTVP